mgnify:CR=1 FL=1
MRMWPACLKELFGAGIFGDFIIPNRLAAQRLRFTFLSLMLIAKARKGDGEGRSLGNYLD